MALNKNTLKAAIRAAMEKQIAKTSPTADPAQGREEFSEDLATAIYNFIKTAQVNQGIAVQVSTMSGTGATTAPGTLS